MVDHPAARFRPRGRMGSGLLYIMSVCAIGGDAIYAESDPAAEVPEYCTVFHHQVGNGAKKVAAPNNGGLHDETVNLNGTIRIPPTAFAGVMRGS